MYTAPFLSYQQIIIVGGIFSLINLNDFYYKDEENAERDVIIFFQ